MAGPTQTPVPVPVQPSRRRSPALAQASRPPRRTSTPSTRRPFDLVAPEITYHVPQSGHAHSSLLPPHAPWPPPRLDRAGPPPMASVVTPAPPPKPQPMSASTRSPPRPDRNIDMVVLGNLCFRTWYPSYYGKEVLGDCSGNNARPSGAKHQADAKQPLSKKTLPMLERLYVCPRCFKYAKELVVWRGHVRLCERRAHVPGNKIYVHPKGSRKVLVPYDAKAPAAPAIGPKRRRGDGGVRYVQDIVHDQGEWSLWEVDGEKDGLFCQNLSLFAKLFLDNKSVFFDVVGFKYFLLVYTPPLPESCPTPSPRPPLPQVVGFFSKEKLSWDNNNLACILVFPPWQRKGLGSLLMGASYEISRREGIMGGPEKPISDLGKKGYKRYWAGEIARWLLSCEQGGAQDETIIDVNDISQGTWISPDDCLWVLRDMDAVQEAGMGPANTAKAVQSVSSGSWRDADREREADAKGQAESSQPSGHDDAIMGSTKKCQGDACTRPAKLMPRVRVDREAVRLFISAQGISLDRSCDPAGFVDGYAMKPVDRTDDDWQGGGVEV
ncbi:hypothetical protein CDD82_4154 [Ophiocordyceps australis]|uniref:histone acetyltransferase n=1 Tax=Ophiocordyceps australis TaxID=1399860 RepID=A0A2C5Z7T6_9HYPO|nr:hypothetical protein CDD82_4154 [Ophiocordyceps australis]